MNRIDELKKELAALEGVKTQEHAKPTEQDIYNIPLEEYLDFTRFPITSDERRAFDEAVAAYNRRRYAIPSDPDPDAPEGFVAMDRKVQRMLRHIRDL